MFMRSDGGLTQASTFTGSHAILSGPAGGVVGYAQTSPKDRPLVGFDMGGMYCGGGGGGGRLCSNLTQRQAPSRL